MATSIYHTTAKQIIRNSIRSAIFIDDNLAVPFKANQTESETRLSRALYNSFVQSNVSIDFYKYNPRNNWKASADYLFKGRDLIVLDWQLDNDDKEKNTLEILKAAVSTPSLHFVCIYTAKNPSEFEDIAYSIKAFFSTIEGNHITQPTDEIINFLDERLPDGFTNALKQRLISVLKEFTLGNQTDISENLNKAKIDITSIFGDEITAEFQRQLGIRFRAKIEKALEAFSYGLSNVFVSNTPSVLPIVFHLDRNFIVIDNTIILITNKSNPRPKSLYTFFTNALLKSIGNFLSLLSLDLKSILRDSSGFISKELDMIDEAAFFYHKDHIEPKEAFFDFVLELWKSNLTAMLLSQNHLIKLFSEEKLAAYRRAKKLEKKIKKYKKQDNADLNQDLAKLNYYYNIIEHRDNTDFIRFGDIFSILGDGGRVSSDYLLCITAHCDCLHIENIKSQFFFVRGQAIDIKEALAEGDSGNNSFLLDREGKVICVKWTHKPFTIFLQNNRILNGIHEVQIRGAARRLAYAATIKENYTQRIANNAFTHPMRVGIFFAKKL